MAAHQAPSNAVSEKLVELVACPELQARWGQVVKAIARRVRAEDSDLEFMSFGWREYIKIEVQFPRAGKELGLTNGHTHHYSIGGGRRPGIRAIGKDGTKFLCGAAGPSGSDGFAAVSAMAPYFE